MIVKMLNTESGRHPGFDTGSYHLLEGHEYEVPDKLAKAWIAQGICKKVRTAPKESSKKESKVTKAKEKNDGN